MTTFQNVNLLTLQHVPIEWTDYVLQMYAIVAVIR